MSSKQKRGWCYGKLEGKVLVFVRQNTLGLRSLYVNSQDIGVIIFSDNSYFRITN